MGKILLHPEQSQDWQKLIRWNMYHLSAQDEVCYGVMVGVFFFWLDLVTGIAQTHTEQLKRFGSLFLHKGWFWVLSETTDERVKEQCVKNRTVRKVAQPLLNHHANLLVFCCWCKPGHDAHDAWSAQSTTLFELKPIFLYMAWELTMNSCIVGLLCHDVCKRGLILFNIYIKQNYKP